MNVFKLARHIIFIVTLISTQLITLKAQNISFTLQKTNTLDQSDKNLFINDINGDTCSLAIVKTEIKNIKFYTNRSVERIENNGKEYRVWIANGSTILKMAIPDLPLLEYKFHNTNKQPTLYIFILEIYSDSSKSTIIYNDTINPVFSINTNPRDAKLFVNNFLVGKTPAQVPIATSGETFNYKIVKSGYVPVKGADSTRNNDYSLTFELVPRSKVKMNFIELQIGMTYFNSTYWNGTVLTNDYHAIYGLTFGKIGGSGWYSSTKVGYLLRSLEGPLTSPKFNDLRLSFGLTQSLTKVFQSYGKLGLGYVLSKDTYTDNSTGEDVNYNVNGFCFDIGIILKMGNRILFSAEMHPIIGKYYQPRELDFGIEFIDFDFSFGLGYAFNMKK